MPPFGFGFSMPNPRGGGPSNSAEVTAYIGRVQAQGAILLPGVASELDTLVANLKADGTWSSITDLHIACGVSTAAGACVKLVSSNVSYLVTAVGYDATPYEPAYIPSGIDAGFNQYSNLRFIISQAPPPVARSITGPPLALPNVASWGVFGDVFNGPYIRSTGSVGGELQLYSETAAITKGRAYTNYQQTGGTSTIVPGTSAVVCGGDALYAREVNRFTIQACNVTPTTATGAQGALIGGPYPIALSTGLAAWFATTNLTFAQTQSIRNRVKNCLGSVAIGRVYGINAFYYWGDQLTDGRNNQAGAIAWPNQLASQSTYPTWAGKQVNLAMQNTTASVLATSLNVYVNSIGQTGPSQYQKAIHNVFYGTADLNNGATAATTLTNLQSIWARIRNNQAGKVIAFTIAPRNDTGWTAPKEAERVSLNSQIRSSSANYDALIDIDLIPNLTNPNNTTYYQADKFNLTTAGQTVLANYVYATINPNTI